MKDTVVLYHFPCLDGFTAAWAAKRALGDTADYIPADYSKPLPTEDLRGKTVYFVDYAFKRDKMLEVAKVAKEIIVLDHHKTAIEDLAELYEQGVIKGVFDLNRSGAGIVWDYFFPDEPRPTLIDMVEDRDLWRFTWPTTKPYNLTMFSYDYDFDTWDKIAFGEHKSFGEMVSDGEAIERKHMKDVRELAQNAMFLTIGDYSVPVVNANYTYGSEVASYLLELYPNAAFGAYFWIGKDRTYNFGLRSKDDREDVAKIAASYGGGGHRNASGFKVKSLRDL